MFEILQSCIDLDTQAEQLYSHLARECADPEIAPVFSQMAAEERVHIGWWSELLSAWRDGLLPDIADEHGILERLQEIRQEFATAIPDDCSSMTTDQMLSIAAHLEFYMLDPVFGEMLTLMQPGRTAELEEAYSKHVLRLVEAIEKHHTVGDLAMFLARVLRRTYRDQQRLSALAQSDPLTGLLNRRGLFDQLRQWLSWSRRYDRPLAVVLIDLDDFKEINDRYGHVAGDQALRGVGEALRDATRASDVIARFGGDEFVVLAPETGEKDLELLMSRIVTTVRDTDFPVAGETARMTASAGGSWVPGGIDIDFEALIVAADRSLYQAKGEGRDRSGAPLVAVPTHQA